MTKIQLGDKVKCIHTGFTGTVVTRSEFINGCVQLDVLPKGDKKNKMPEAQAIDEQSLKLISPVKKKTENKENGGPMRKGFIQRGF